MTSVYAENENLGVLYRLYVHSSLRSKIIRPPFLTLEEKYWLGLLLMKSVKQLHELHMPHGDLRPENFLLTSWNWVFLADFAFYKPTTIPEGNLTLYNLFFAPGTRDACYLAPERFESKADKEKARLGLQADIFSLGCVLAEVFLDGDYLFNLSQVLSLKKNGLDDLPKLSLIDGRLKELIMNMVCIDPGKRWEIDRCLKFYFDYVVDKEVCSRLYEFSIGVVKMNSADERVDMVQDYLKQDKTGNMAVVLFDVLASCILNVTYPSLKIRSMKLMRKLDLSDDGKLHRVVPYLTSLLNKEEKDKVKCTALRIIPEVLETIKSVNTKDLHLFKECVWPLVALCKNDENDWVRYSLAVLIPNYARAIRRLLEIWSFSWTSGNNFDMELKNFGKIMGGLYQDMLESNEERVQLVLLSNFPHFAAYFSADIAKGVFKEFILPWMAIEERFEEVPGKYVQVDEKYQIAILNESEKYIEVLGGYFIYHMHRYLEVNLYGKSENLIYLTLKTLNLSPKLDLNILEKTLPLFIHPNKWIRDEMKSLVNKMITNLDPTLNFLHIRPMMMPYLHLENIKLFIIDSAIIESSLYDYINRDYYNHSIEITHTELMSDTLQGIVASLISMVRLPYKHPEVIKILPMPDENEHVEEPNQSLFFFNESFRRVNSSRTNFFDGLGITGELEHILDAHSGRPVRKLLQTHENHILSASDDGKIVMWKFTKPDDYNNVKYKEKKETQDSPINLGNCADCIYVSYPKVIQVWDQEFCQVEQEIKIDQVCQVIDINDKLLISDQQGEILLKDLRDPSIQKVFSLGAQKGIISSMVKSSDYTFTLGTITGHLVLFDLRFNLPCSSHYNSYKQPVLSMANYFCRYKPIIDGAQVLTGISNEVVMWDLDSMRTSALFTRKKESPLQVPYLVSDPFYFRHFSPCGNVGPFNSINLEKFEIYSRISKSFITNLTEFGASVKRTWETRSNVLKIYVPNDSHLILSTGEDALVRIWDPISVKNSAILGHGGLIKPDYASALLPDLLIIQEQPYPGQPSKKKKRDFDDLSSSRKLSHSHTINDLLFVNSPKPLLLTASNDGTIRVWG